MRLLSIVLTGLLAVSCSRAEVPPPAPDRDASAPARQAPARPRIVVLGDSLAAGYGLEPEESFPARLQQRIDAAGLAYEVSNVSVSGDTSAGGVRRLDYALDGDVRVVILELGANDGLRGLPVDQMQANLATIIERAQARGAAVVLAGMEAPPNFGPAYTAAFRRVYRALAEQYDTALVPFLLDGVAGDPSLNIADGIHPNKDGVRIVEGNVWRALEPLLTRPTR